MAAKPGPKLEPLSSRLKASLIHPDKTSYVYGPFYSPDGKRIIAGDAHASVIQVWDAESGRQLTKIEVGHGHVGPSAFFTVSPDWKTVYVPRAKEITKQVEKDGKVSVRQIFHSKIRTYDLTTGQVSDIFEPNSPRLTTFVRPSPDGRRFWAFDSISRDDGSFDSVWTLWDVKTKQAVPDTGLPTFSPDGRTAVRAAQGEGEFTSSLKVVDATTFKERVTIPIQEKFAEAGVWHFSPDGRTLIGYTMVYDSPNDRQKWQMHLKVWDAVSGKELATFPAPEKNFYLTALASPAGKNLVAMALFVNKPKLFLIDLVEQKIVKTVTLENMSITNTPAVSPDGKWLALATLDVTLDAYRRLQNTPDDLPQPRIHLIDFATGEIRETLIAPQGAGMHVSFSPDGKTLATSGRGRVYLWDMTKPPGTVQGAGQR